MKTGFARARDEPEVEPSGDLVGNGARVDAAVEQQSERIAVYNVIRIVNLDLATG